MSRAILGLERPDEAHDWDPKESQRSYYRHERDGQLGWKVRRRGVDMIRLDRGDVETTVPLKCPPWVPEREHRPLNRAQVAMICHATDRMVCKALGLHGDSKKDWVDLKQEEKKEWMQEGPKHPSVRVIIYTAIKTALRELTL